MGLSLRRGNGLIRNQAFLFLAKAGKWQSPQSVCAVMYCVPRVNQTGRVYIQATVCHEGTKTRSFTKGHVAGDKSSAWQVECNGDELLKVATNFQCNQNNSNRIPQNNRGSFYTGFYYCKDVKQIKSKKYSDCKPQILNGI